ncbi:MAG: lipid-A-disaccharide synthase N-terminal domain-containing protein [Methylomonas sp.]
MDNNTLWLIIGFSGQGMFMARFLVQWLASERKKQCVIPVKFWYFSIMGGAISLVYAIHKEDPVFILGQSAGLLIYIRNLYLIIRYHRPELSE